MSTEYTPRYRTSWALVIGINAYQHASPLSYACNDADAVADVLVNDLRFPQDQVILLKDQKATKEAILDAYLGFAKQASDPDDRVLMFFARHDQTGPTWRHWLSRPG